MNMRQLVNAAYAHLMKGRDPAGRAEMDAIIYEKRWSEMTPDEQARAERKRKAIETGAYRGQSELLGAMGLPQGRRRPT